MRIVVIANPRSGRGRGLSLAERATRAVAEAGGDAVLVDVLATNGTLAPMLKGAAGAVVVGGDGTIHHALDALVESGCPVWMVGAGTENLFARAWGMRRDAADLADALRSGRSRVSDLGSCNGRRFALMCSAGFDAEVIRRLHGGRTGRITHAAYIAPIMRTLADWDAPRLRARVDGRTIVDGAAGLAIVSNASEYAARLNPARFAAPDDTLLDLTFIPANDGGEILVAAAAVALRRHTRLRGAAYARARHIEIESLDGPCPCQADGELMPFGVPLSVHVEPAALRVIGR